MRGPMGSGRLHGHPADGVNRVTRVRVRMGRVVTVVFMPRHGHLLHQALVVPAVSSTESLVPSEARRRGAQVLRTPKILRFRFNRSSKPHPSLRLGETWAVRPLLLQVPMVGWSFRRSSQTLLASSGVCRVDFPWCCLLVFSSHPADAARRGALHPFSDQTPTVKPRFLTHGPGPET